jgi:hypothetical protein
MGISAGLASRLRRGPISLVGTQFGISAVSAMRGMGEMGGEFGSAGNPGRRGVAWRGLAVLDAAQDAEGTGMGTTTLPPIGGGTNAG